MSQSQIKVSFIVRNVKNGGSFGHISTRTTKFDNMTDVSQYINRIYKGLQINGYEVYSTPTIE